jgi:hypothetical protein
MKKWKLFELKDENYCTLFHHVNGSRYLPRGRWITAKQVVAREGSHGRKYRTGFHVFDSFDTVKEFLDKFKAPRKLVALEVDVQKILRKKPTNNKILLVKKIRIPINPKYRLIWEIANAPSDTIHL